MYGNEIYLRPARKRERKRERHFEFYEKVGEAGKVKRE